MYQGWRISEGERSACRSGEKDLKLKGSVASLEQERINKKEKMFRINTNKS